MGCTSHDKHGYKNGILREIRFHVVPHFTRPRRDTSDAEERERESSGRGIFVRLLNKRDASMFESRFGVY